MRPGLSRSIKHFGVEVAGIVFGEEFGHEITVSPPLRGANKNAVPHLKSSPTGKDTAKWRVIGLRRRNSTGRTLPSQCCLPEVCELNRRSHFLSRELPAKMARSGSPDFSPPALVFRRRRFRRRHRLLPG